MATFDSPYLLDLFNRVTGRPAADAILDTTKYKWLTEANNELIGLIAGICPNTLLGAPTACVTSDSKVFTFGSDSNGYAIAPIGKTGIYTSLSSVPDLPWVEGLDYLNEGEQIRIPHDGTYSGTLYWRGITPPADLTAISNPTLFPAASRVLIPHIAALNYGKAAARNPSLVDEMMTYLGEPWGMNKGAFARWALTWKTQFRKGGALGTNFTGRSLALLTQI